MRKIIALYALCLWLSAPPAFAAMLAPKAAPLQPMPIYVRPNISGNIQSSSSPVFEPAGEAVTSTAVASAPHPLPLTRESSPAWLFAVLGVLVALVLGWGAKRLLLPSED